MVLESAEDFRERLESEADEYYGQFEAEDAYVALKALHLVDNRFDLGTLEDPMQNGGTLGYFDP